ncbi:MAG TPA: sodium/solute symporter, partial [Gemmatimonadales bacterium]|nr:sodium/solute symporter [Gemmatimonadales bacterium]
MTVQETGIGQPNPVAEGFFFAFIAVTLGITWWAARRTRTADHFYAAGRSVTAGQNGFALAGDYMSAASFLGIAGLVSTTGFDGLIYSTGWLVGWPVVLFLIAEPLRNLGRYTFADVLAARLSPAPVRVAAAAGTLATVTLYLIAQMVGAGGLITLMFGLTYETAIVLVGAAMIAYVLFGGMLATTWVQIVKAVLLLGGAALLALLVLARFEFNPARLFAAAAERYGDGVLAPGKLVANPLDAVSLGIALMFGTAGLPHILMRFYTVPDARAARRSVFYATGLIGIFYLMTFVLGFGAMVLVGPDAIRAVDKGGNMAAPLLAELLGGRAFLGFIAAVAFATILAVVAGLTLSGAAALSHDLWVNVVRGRRAVEGEELKVARVATLGLGVLAVLLGIAFKGQNVAFMVSLAFAIAASANFPALLLCIFWRGCTTAGAVASMAVGTVGTLTLIALSPTVQVEILGRPDAWFPLKNPALVTLPASFAAGIA